MGLFGGSHNMALARKPEVRKSDFPPLGGDNGAGSDKFRAAFGDMITQNGDSGIAKPDELAALIGQAPRQNKGGLGDVLASILAVAADATDPEGRGIYTRNIAQQWGQRREGYNNALTSFQNRQQMANLPGMTQRELAAYIADPKAWASQMAGAATSRYQAATLNPGDQRYLGEGNGVYQAPTRGQLYAQSLDLEPGSEAYATALRDQEMGAQGPTAFDNARAMEGARQQARAILEQQRQQGRTSLEGIRQGNRVNLRGVPTAGRLGAPPPRLGNRAPPQAPMVPTASDASGNTIYLRGGRWVDGQGRPVQ